MARCLDIKAQIVMKLNLGFLIEENVDFQTAVYV
jgi:hypothetical protein